MTPEERERRMQERLASMTPEQRTQFEARMRDRGQGQGGRPGAPAGAPAQAGGGLTGGATTIDALFAPLPVVERRERVWTFGNGDLKAINIRTGISDGTWTELIEGSGIQQGTELVTNITTGLEPAPRPGQSPAGGPQNPMMGTQPQRGGGRGR
jgi:hypothetical protein